MPLATLLSSYGHTTRVVNFVSSDGHCLSMIRVIRRIYNVYNDASHENWSTTTKRNIDSDVES